MQHLSIALAFIAVFGLAAYRMLDGEPRQVTVTASTPVQQTPVQPAPFQPAPVTVRRQDPAVNQKLVEEVDRLTRRLKILETDIGDLRTRNDQLESQVKQLIAANSVTTSSIPKRPAADAKSTISKTPGPALRTGSLPGGGPEGPGIHLATFADPAALSVAWRALQSSEPAALSKLEPFAVSVKSPEGDRIYRLVAGPMSSERDARALCDRLKSRNRFCKVSIALGTPLANIVAKN